MPLSGRPALLIVIPLLLAGCGRDGEAPDGATEAVPQVTAASGNASALPGAPAPATARLPFERLQAIVLAAVPGEIIEVELERDDHDGHGSQPPPHKAGLYEFKVLAASGRVMEVKIDARTGAIIALEAE